MSVAADPALRHTDSYFTASLAAVVGSAREPLPVVFGRSVDLAVMGSAAAVALAVCSWIIGGAPWGDTAAFIATALVSVLWLSAAILSFRVSTDLRLDRGSRRAWMGIATAWLLTTTSGAIALSPWPMPQLTSPLTGYAAFLTPLVLLGAFLQMPSAPRSALDRTALWLDVGTVATGSALVLWYQLYATATGSGVSTSTLTGSDLLVLADVVLLLVLSVLWRRTAFRCRACVTGLLTMSVLMTAFGHAGASYALSHGLNIPGWLGVFSPLAALLSLVSAWLKLGTVGALSVRTPVHAARAKFAASLLPYLAVVPGFALVLLAAREQALQPLEGLVIGAVLLTILAFLRQMAAGRESVRALIESAARTNEARFQALVQHSSDIITILDAYGAVRYASPSTATMLGHEPSRLVGTQFADLIHPEDVEAATTFLADLARSQGPRATPALAPGLQKREWRIRHANGDWMTVDNVGTNLLREPLVKGLVLNTRDVTEQSVIKQQYMHQAFHDSLTDLANRSLFLYQVGHALARGNRAQQPVTVMFLDLDNFKTVNDSLGHAAGDRLLVDAARRLASCVRDSDLIARLGGDEFAVLIEDAPNVDEVLEIADRIAAAMSRPFQLSGKEVFVSASIGIARTSKGETSDELVRNADVAMYVAKTRGKGMHVLFELEMHTAALERLVVEADLRAAIEREEFFLEYQPIVLLATGEIIGAEALVRWACRERGTVPPGVFIPFAEETGLIVQIGNWVLRRACRMAQQWERERGHPMRISVNLSGRQLQEPTIVDEVRSALADAGLDPAHLVLEITESMLMHNTEMSMSRLLALKNLGVSLAIDDFGTGYSSLSYLQRYPIDILKIDKAFVDAIDKGGEGPVLASAIVALGETLRMNTVAEGIETEAQRGKLLQLGCELGQGFLFAPPLEASEFYRLLLARGARSYATASKRRDVGAQAA